MSLIDEKSQRKSDLVCPHCNGALVWVGSISTGQMQCPYLWCRNGEAAVKKGDRVYSDSEYRGFADLNDLMIQNWDGEDGS